MVPRFASIMSKEQGASPRARHSVWRRWPLGLFVAGVLVVALAVLGVAVGIGQAKRVTTADSAQKAIVGKWVNSVGGEIDFNADGTGYIPPAAGLQAYTFSYYFESASHLVMNMTGETMTVEIKLAGDKMTWVGPGSSGTYEYTRIK